MRRWNGWGDEAVAFPLPASGAEYLRQAVGQGVFALDASLEGVLNSVPASRLPAHPLITSEAHDRLRHARGQSLPDWVALRSGRVGAFPDGVAYPASDEDVRALLAFARRAGTRLIPYGGGTSVVGHINPVAGEAPTLTVDLRNLNRLKDLDEISRLAAFEAGVRGPEVEAQLRAHGFTLGHYPQSYEYSTLGGWIATRSSGQQSYYYGRIEDLFVGGSVETPQGPFVLPAYPASAAGPDVRELLLGSEGRLGIITRACVRVRPLPQSESFHGVFFRDWESGVQAAREIAQARLPLSMLRLSDATETETTLALAGRERLVAWGDRGLRALGYGPGRCLLLLGLTVERGLGDQGRGQAFDVARARGGLVVGAAVGNLWRKTRFRAPYLRNSLWDLGYALDTMETAVAWSALLPAASAIAGALRGPLEDQGERALVLTHLSHVYVDGASLYFTVIFRRATDPDETLGRWEKLKFAASRAILRAGGTISHQHGVGIDHAPYLAEEKGHVGLALLQAAQRALDPDGLLNPGKLIPDDVGLPSQG